jgi:CO/xanthine dehydrogenase FAD-binding subunit
VFRDDDGRTTIALGSVGPTPIRPRRAEEMISAEQNPSAAALAELQRLVSEEVSPITDHRSTEEYRRHASGVLARRLLERILGR